MGYSQHILGPAGIDKVNDCCMINFLPLDLRKDNWYDLSATLRLRSTT